MSVEENVKSQVAGTKVCVTCSLGRACYRSETLPDVPRVIVDAYRKQFEEDATERLLRVGNALKVILIRNLNNGNGLGPTRLNDTRWQ